MQSTIPERRSTEKHLTTVIVLAVVLVLWLLAYFMFFH
jgi:hypothetical protein